MTASEAVELSRELNNIFGQQLASSPPLAQCYPLPSPPTVLSPLKPNPNEIVC